MNRVAQAKRDRFTLAYHTECNGNATKAAIAAGYNKKSAYASGSRLLKDARVQSRLDELAKQEIAVVHAVMDKALNVESVLEELEDERIMAIGKGDLAVAVKCTELKGKHLGMFSETITLDIVKVREYSEQERIEASRLARLMILGVDGNGLPSGLQADYKLLPVLDAEPEIDRQAAQQQAQEAVITSLERTSELVLEGKEPVNTGKSEPGESGTPPNPPTPGGFDTNSPLPGVTGFEDHRFKAPVDLPPLGDLGNDLSSEQYRRKQIAIWRASGSFVGVSGR